MIENFFDSIKFLIIFVAIGIGATIIIVAVKSFSEHANDRAQKQQAAEEEKQNKERRRIHELQLEKRKDSYWQNLSSVYGDKDRETLEKALEWLEDLYRLQQADDPSMVAVNERGECRENIKKILNNPQWIIIEGEYNDSPIWVDLDIKYVKLLLS